MCDVFCHGLESFVIAVNQYVVDIGYVPHQGPLLRLPTFQVQMIRGDGMRIINLGVDLWVTASVIKKLLQYDGVFGGLDEDEGSRLLKAYDLFRAWSRINKVQYPEY